MATQSDANRPVPAPTTSGSDAVKPALPQRAAPLWSMLLVALCAWAGAGLGELWYGETGRTVGVSVGFVLGYIGANVITALVWRQTVDPTQLAILVAICVPLLAQGGDSPTISSEIRRIIPVLVSVIAVFLGFSAFRSWQRRRKEPGK